MAVEGTLDLFKVPEILQLVAQQRKTGILTIQGQQDIIAISFLNGQIVTADALNQTVEEGLSQVLVGEGLMTSVEFQRVAAEFQRASAESQSSGGRLLDHLVERRYVGRPELLRALRIQTTRLLEQLMVWDKGEFKFYSGDEVSYEEGFVPIPVDELLFQAAQRTANANTARPSPVARPVAVPAPAPAPTVPTGGMGPLPGPDELARYPGTGPAPRPPAAAPTPPAAAAAEEAAARPGLRVVRREGPPPAAVRTSGAGGEAEAAGPYRKMKVEAPAAAAPQWPIAPKLLAAGLAILAVTVLLLRPESMLLPFPWQEGEREILTQDRRSSLYLKVDQAAKTRFLLEGSFPAQLADLAQSGLLSRADLRDPQGHPFRYEPSQESYILQPVDNGKPVEGADTSEAITGNFLLDPEFLAIPADAVANPLVLLD
jgi:hypothetical protein